MLKIAIKNQGWRRLIVTIIIIRIYYKNRPSISILLYETTLFVTALLHDSAIAALIAALHYYTQRYILQNTKSSHYENYTLLSSYSNFKIRYKQLNTFSKNFF